MCGICGFAGIDEEYLLDNMMDALIHRGPDNKGKFWDKKTQIGLGHRRLSIVDVKGGNQPIFNEDKSVCLVCNGMVYNFKELREKLEAKGHIFYTQTDCEVIIHMYEEEGEECVNNFNGKFAFAIWDEKKRKLFIGRDRLGISPLYYTFLNGKFIFASTIKSILQWSLIKRDINFLSLDDYLTFRYVPGPRTMIKNIFELPPGCVLIYQNGAMKISKYWGIGKKKNVIGAKSSQQQEQYYEMLVDSVEKRLLSDVPIGLYLSGGIDSSSILSIMNNFNREPIKTFSVGFKYGPDELKQARDISSFYKTQHHELIIQENDFQFLSEIVQFLDNPLGDAIIVPLYCLSKMAKEEKVKVILTGDGSDELLGGYVHHFIVNYLEIYKKTVPGFIQTNLVNKLLELMPLKILDLFFPYPASLGQAGKKRFLDYFSANQKEQDFYSGLLSLFSVSDKKELYTKELSIAIENDRNKQDLRINCANMVKKNNGDNFLEEMIYHDMVTWLPNNILFKNDRMAMANSIDCRVPFLDHRLVEFCLNLSSSEKIKGKVNKYFLRKTMQKHLPESVTKRKKMPFYFPVDKYFNGKVKEYVLSVLSSSRIKNREYFNCDYIEKILKNRHNSSLLYDKQIMSLVILELWNEFFIDDIKI